MSETTCTAASRFIADAMLGRLATWLRILGHDAEYFQGDDRLLVARARAEGRILLTRDTGLLRRADLPAHVFIRSDHVREQLLQLAVDLRLALPARGARRCPRCNLPLAPVARPAVRGRVPEYVWASQERFWSCGGCERIYWAGTHRQRMEEFIRALTAAAGMER